MDSKEKSKLDSRHGEEMQEAFSWYNRVLGFQIDGEQGNFKKIIFGIVLSSINKYWKYLFGPGAKFTITNIDRKYPMEEYSFTICLWMMCTAVLATASDWQWILFLFVYIHFSHLQAAEFILRV